MVIEACIFDLDGVIVKTDRYHFLAWKKLADLLGINFTEEDNERLKGVSRAESLEIILEIGKRKADQRQKAEYANMKNEWYIGYINKMTPAEILPGSISFINELKGAGILVAIGSASRNTPLILEKTGMKDLFDAVSDGNIVTRAKPDPEVFIKAANLLRADPGNCIVFEDAIAGIRAARNAGMACIGIGSPDILTEADFVISGLDKMNLEKLKSVTKDIR